MSSAPEPEAPRRLRRTPLAAMLVLAVLAALATAVVAAVSVRVDGSSMAPTLHSGDLLLSEPGTAGRAGRFDVVLLRRPGRAEVLVKRVIGLPGDRVEIVSTPEDPYQVLVQPDGRGQWFRVRVDGWAAQAHRAAGCCGPDGLRVPQGQVQTVPPGGLFYLGDNPDGSDDARAFGWGRIELVQGRVWKRVWPLSAGSAIGGDPRLEPVAGPTP